VLKSFTVNLAADPDVVLAQAKKVTAQNGGIFKGDTHSGQFSARGVVGEYKVKGKAVILTITEKPILMPWFVVESKIKSFFQVEVEPEEPLGQPAALNESEEMMHEKVKADQIVRSHVLWSMGAGLIPLPLFDLAAVAAIQMDMLQQLAALYKVDYSKSMGKTFVSALTGSTFAKIGATLIKSIPGIGTILGGISMSALSGASTYAVGQVVINHLETSGDFLNIDLAWAKRAYSEAFEEGKKVVSDLEEEQEEAQDVFEALEKLGDLKEKGIITAEEFEVQKQKLLDRL
jgi:uncharacterized protein (DUF697 family)